MEYSVYILVSLKDNKYYIGQTSNLSERLSAHNRGSVKSTKNRRPLDLIYSERCSSRERAIEREKYFKGYKNTRDLLSVLGVVK